MYHRRSPEDMETWMFYSYKGGSGRTVASANIATALAKLGKRVLIIDMDFEQPGLHTVFRVEETDTFKRQEGIQDYFKGDISVDEVRDRIIFDLALEGGLVERFITPEGACCLYLMAAPRTSDIFTSVVDLEGKMNTLIRVLGKQENLDYIILDAASGIRSAFALSIHACDKMAIFFRWSRQHVEGTKRIVRLLKRMEGLIDGLYRPFRLIASVVPGDSDLDRLDNEVLAKLLRGAKKRSEKDLIKDFGDEGKLFGEIPEMVELKWQESVMVFNRDGTCYEKIAEKIIAEG